MGCTADWWHRWHSKAIQGYKHHDYEKMYILFFSDRCNCKGDKELERMFPDAEERQQYKDTDRSNGRLEKRLFSMLRDNGEGRRGFLNVGDGSEGLANGPVWGTTYLAVKKKEGLERSKPTEGCLELSDTLLERWIE